MICPQAPRVCFADLRQTRLAIAGLRPRPATRAAALKMSNSKTQFLAEGDRRICIRGCQPWIADHDFEARRKIACMRDGRRMLQLLRQRHALLNARLRLIRIPDQP